MYIYRSLSIRNLPSIPILRPGVTRTSTDFLFLRLTCVVEDLWIFSSDEDVVVYPPHSDIQNTNIIIVILCSIYAYSIRSMYVPCSSQQSPSLWEDMEFLFSRDGQTLVAQPPDQEPATQPVPSVHRTGTTTDWHNILEMLWQKGMFSPIHYRIIILTKDKMKPPTLWNLRRGR